MAKITIEGRFTIVPNELVNDPSISFKAKGLYAYIHAKPDGWEFSAERIASECKDGTDSVRAGLRELESSGYLTRHKTKNNEGKFEYEYELKCQKPPVEKPTVENPPVEKPPLNKERNTNTDKERNILSATDKKEEKQRNAIKLFDAFIASNFPISEEERPASYYVILDMMLLGWKPAVGETPDTFRTWLTELAQMYSLTRNDVITMAREWRIYWESRTDKSVKQHKTSLMNSIAFNIKRRNG